MYSAYSLILFIRRGGLIQTINLTMFMQLKLTTSQPTNKAHLHFFQRLILPQKRQKSFGFFRTKKKNYLPFFFLFLGHCTYNNPVASKYMLTIY